ncbi:MAG: hypothetical protein IKS41_01255 [Alphaproteobacteria bacterium]|nr:hypothetical protein [Alphaproteobacteria bacterium]
MGATLKLGKRVPKTEEYPEGWKIIYTHRRGPLSEESWLGKKSMICFPGDGVIYDEEMNGCCSNMRRMLENAGMAPEDMPDFYSVGFDTDTQDHRQQMLEKEGMTRYGLQEPDKITDYWKPFFDAYLLALVQSPDGKPRPIEESVRNLQNVTFVTHCHGSMFARQMELMLQEKVKEFYPGREKEVLGNVRMLHLASRKPMEQDTGVKHLNVVSLADDSYADKDILAEDNVYKLLHGQTMEGRSAIIPTSENEALMVFKELTTQKTFGENRDDHSHFMKVVSGKERGIDDPEAQENEDGLNFVRTMLRHFVEYPDDFRSMKDIMRGVNSGFTIKNIKEGHKLTEKMSEEKQFGKAMLDLLSQHSVRIESGDAAFYLQRMSNGEYFYQQAKKRALAVGDQASLVSILKKVGGKLAPEIAAQEVQEAMKRGDRRSVDAITDQMKAWHISKYILSPAKPENLPFLYPEIKKAKLSESNQNRLIEELLEKAQKIPNSSGRVQVETYLKQEKEKYEIQTQKARPNPNNQGR